MITMDPDVKAKLDYIRKRELYRPALSRLLEALAIRFIEDYEERNGPIEQAELD